MLYIVTRDCCLGPCCSRGHAPNKPVRVIQIRTSNKEQAERCCANFNKFPHTYNAKLSVLEETLDADTLSDLES